MSMPDSRLSVHDRVAALEHLERVARDLNLMAAWLGEAGIEYEADLLDGSARDLLDAGATAAAEAASAAVAAARTAVPIAFHCAASPQARALAADQVSAAISQRYA